MTTKTFTATIAKVGSRVYVSIPFDPNKVWGVKDRHHITGTINEQRIRGPLTVEGENYVLTLGEAWRRDNGLATGDVVTVTLAAEGPQTDAMSPDVAAALDSDPQAKAFFASLATFYRRNFIRDIEGAKRPETRAARIAEMMRLLKAGKKQR